MKLDHFKVIRKPIVTEKSTMGEMFGQVTFEVDPSATKHQIREAVESIFKVKVVNVNTMRMRGKPVRRGFRLTNRRNWKKAVITLKEGDSIDFYEGV
jgi:large subunit ribosomal protein L23